MNKISEKLLDWKERLKDRHMLSVVVVAICICLALGAVIYIQKQKYRQTTNNDYNRAFYELVNSMQNVETLLAKSLISSSMEHTAKTLSELWKEASVAQQSLALIPVDSENLSNTSKFINQTSDYAYSLSRKSIGGEDLTGEEIENLENLYNHAVNMEQTLNQLAMDINEGSLKWEELEKKATTVLAREVSNISGDSLR